MGCVADLPGKPWSPTWENNEHIGKKNSENHWNIQVIIGTMYGIYANIGGILTVNVTIYGIHGSYGK